MAWPMDTQRWSANENSQMPPRLRRGWVGVGCGTIRRPKVSKNNFKMMNTQETNLDETAALITTSVKEICREFNNLEPDIATNILKSGSEMAFAKAKNGELPWGKAFIEAGT